MDRADRTRACYQHCALKWVMADKMTNQSLRKRFGLPDGKQAIVSQIITGAIEQKLIKLDENAGTSKRYAKYLPSWA
jgi:ATP-dependent DNA helicase RecG